MRRHNGFAQINFTHKNTQIWFNDRNRRKKLRAIIPSFSIIYDTRVHSCLVFNYKLESVADSEEKQRDDDSYPTLGETRLENRTRERKIKIPFLLASLYLGPQQLHTF